MSNPNYTTLITIEQANTYNITSLPTEMVASQSFISTIVLQDSQRNPMDLNGTIAVLEYKPANTVVGFTLLANGVLGVSHLNIEDRYSFTVPRDILEPSWTGTITVRWRIEDGGNNVLYYFYQDVNLVDENFDGTDSYLPPSLNPVPYSPSSPQCWQDGTGSIPSTVEGGLDLLSCAVDGNQTPAAVDVTYDNTASGLTAVEVQSALDEIESRVEVVEDRADVTDTEQAFQDVRLDSLESGETAQDLRLDALETNDALQDTNISTNTGNISTNTSNISTNSANIATNSADISTNVTNINTNTSDISTNTGNISSNSSDISALQADQHNHANKAVLDATQESYTTLDKLKLDGIEANATQDQLASEVPVDTSSFNNNLSSNEDTVQKALNILDDIQLTADEAHEISVDTSLFNNNLSALDDTVQKALDTIDDLDINGAVDSVHGRTGVVVSATGDYDAVQIDNTPSGNISSTNVQSALNELDAEKEPAFGKNTAFNKNFGVNAGEVCEGNDPRLSDARTPTAHASSHEDGGLDEIAGESLSVTNAVTNYTPLANTLKGHLDGIDNELGTIVPDQVSSVFGRQGAVVAQSSDYDAVQVDYDNTSSGMTAVNVQSAIDEVEGRIDSLETDSHTHANKAILDATTASFTSEYVARYDGQVSSGIMEGGILSVGTPNTTFSISDGWGYVVDIKTDPDNPVVNKVTWTGLTNIPVTNIATNLITFVCIESNLTVVQDVSRWSRERYRTCLVIGVVVHVDKTIVDTVNQEHSPSGQYAAGIADIMEGLGFVNVNGNTFSSNGANLEIQKSEGIMMQHGINYYNDVNNPHHLTLIAQSPQTFQYRLQNGTNISTGTLIDPNNYDLNGVLTAVPNNKVTVQRAYLFTSGNVKVQPGQILYNNQEEARLSLFSDPFIVEPSIQANGLFRGYIIVEQGTTDLSNTAKALFIDAGKFGQGSISGGIGGGDNLGDHIATQDLQMGNFDIISVNLVDGRDVSVDGANLDSHIANTSNPHSVVANQVANTPSGNIASTDVQAAINELDSEKEPAFAKNTAFNKDFGTVTGTVTQGDDFRLSNDRYPTAHASSHEAGGLDDIAGENLSVINTVTNYTPLANTLKGHLDGIDTELGTIPPAAPVDSVFGRTGAVVATASDYDANQVDFDNTTSGMTATDVQAAIDEVEGRVDTLEGASAEDWYRIQSGDYTGVAPNWDITTATFSGNEKLVNGQDTAPVGVWVNSANNRAFVMGGGTDKVYSYTFTGGDISTATYDNLSLDVTTQHPAPQDCFLKPDGTEVYVCSGTKLSQYTLSTPFDLSTGTHTADATLGHSTCVGFYISSDGTKIVSCNTTTFYRGTFSTPWDVTTYSNDVGNTAVLANGAYGMTMNDAGTQIFSVARARDTVEQVDMTTAWDLTTASYIADVSNAEETSSDGIYMMQGTTPYFYNVGAGTDSIHQYNITKPAVVGEYELASNSYYVVDLDNIHNLPDTPAAEDFVHIAMNVDGHTTIKCDVAHTFRNGTTQFDLNLYKAEYLFIFNSVASKWEHYVFENTSIGSSRLKLLKEGTIGSALSTYEFDISDLPTDTYDYFEVEIYMDTNTTAAGVPADNAVGIRLRDHTDTLITTEYNNDGVSYESSFDTAIAINNLATTDNYRPNAHSTFRMSNLRNTAGGYVYYQGLTDVTYADAKGATANQDGIISTTQKDGAREVSNVVNGLYFFNRQTGGGTFTMGSGYIKIYGVEK